MSALGRYSAGFDAIKLDSALYREPPAHRRPLRFNLGLLEAS
jgi:hypothetical protein